MAEENQKIAPLQAALDVGMATDEELAKLKVWETYFVLPSRVDVSKAPDVEWLKAPT